MRRLFYLIALWGFALACLWQCTMPEKEQQTHVSHNALPEIETQYAHFHLTKLNEDAYLLVLGNTSNDSTKLHYVLSYSSQVPEEYQELPLIHLPVQNIGVRSTTHLGFLKALNAARPPFLKAIPDTTYIFDSSLRQMAAQGKFIILQEETLPLETIARHCRLLLVSSPLNAAEAEKLARLGVVSLPILEWMETHPLAQTEWIKLFGILTGKTQEAQRYFEHITQAYISLRDSVAQQLASVPRPLVITGLPFRGQWYVAGGQSFMAQFIQDAGGTYYWQKIPQTGSLPIAFEKVYEAGLKADVWLHPGQARSRQEITNTDPRLQDFKSWQGGHVFNRTRRLSPAGGNDYWEQGVVEPHIILADMVKALHPKLLPHHTWKYYEQLP